MIVYIISLHELTNAEDSQLAWKLPRSKPKQPENFHFIYMEDQFTHICHFHHTNPNRINIITMTFQQTTRYWNPPTHNLSIESHYQPGWTLNFRTRFWLTSHLWRWREFWWIPYPLCCPGMASSMEAMYPWGAFGVGGWEKTGVTTVVVTDVFLRVVSGIMLEYVRSNLCY